MSGPAGAPGPDREIRPAAEAYQSADERNKALGLVLLPRWSAAIRVCRSYEPGNQVFQQQLEGLIGVVQPLLEDNTEAVLVALDDDLYLNGVRIPVRTTNIKFHKHLLDEWRKRRIAGVRMLHGVTPADLAVLFRLFREPDVYHGTDLLRACLANGADKVQPVVHASTDAPEDDFEYDAGPEPGNSETNGAWGGTGPGAGYGLSHSPHAESNGDGSGGDATLEYAAPRGAARKSYSTAVQGARSLLMNTSLQSGMELRHAKRVVQPLVDGAFSDDPVVVGLHTLSHHDEYTYAHAVNTTLIAVTMGRLLELDRRMLADLGVAALLHDVGKHAVADEVKHPLDQFDAADWTAVHRHPIEGVKIIARSSALNTSTMRCMHVALEHHMTPDENSYPDFGEHWRPSILSRLVAVADCYVSLQTHRSARGAVVTPYQALGMMLGPLKSRFDPALLWALVQSVGFYPPGQLVQLDDGTIAVVLSPNADDLARPHLRVLLDPAGNRITDRIEEHRPLPATRSIQRALPPKEYPTDPGAVAA